MGAGRADAAAAEAEVVDVKSLKLDGGGEARAGSVQFAMGDLEANLDILR